MKKKNKKGFTLIELLAVIVILAILIMLAVPQVVGIMNKAKFNTFKLEVSSIEEIVNTAYTIDKEEATQKFPSDEVQNCYTLEWLKEEGYTDKNFKNPGCVFLNGDGQIMYLIYNDGNYTTYAGSFYLDDIEYQDFITDFQPDAIAFYNSAVNNITETIDMCTASYEVLTGN